MDERRMSQKNKQMYEWMPQSITHRSHEKSKPLSEENTGTEMLSTCKIFPELKKMITLECCSIPQQDLMHVLCGSSNNPQLLHESSDFV